MKKYKKTLFALIPILILFVVNIVKAQIQLQVALPTANDGTISSVSGLSDYIRIVYNYGIYAGSVIAVIMISINAFKWVSAGGNKSTIGKAKDGMITSMVGLFVLFGSYLILSTINGELVALKALDVRPLDTKAYLEKVERSSGLDTAYYDDMYVADQGRESEGNPRPVAVLRCANDSDTSHYCIDLPLGQPDIQYEFSTTIGACEYTTMQCVSNARNCNKTCLNYSDCGNFSNGYCDGAGPQVCCSRQKRPNETTCSHNIQCLSGCCCNFSWPTRDVCRSTANCNLLNKSCIQ